jgi:hypothetical protein
MKSHQLDTGGKRTLCGQTSFAALDSCQDFAGRLDTCERCRTVQVSRDEARRKAEAKKVVWE